MIGPATLAQSRISRPIRFQSHVQIDLGMLLTEVGGTVHASGSMNGFLRCRPALLDRVARGTSRDAGPLQRTQDIQDTSSGQTLERPLSHNGLILFCDRHPNPF